MKNRFIVMARLETGDPLTAAVRAENRVFNNSDKKKLLLGMKKLKKAEDDTLYYTIRVTYKDRNENYKLLSYEGVLECVEKIWDSFD